MVCQCNLLQENYVPKAGLTFCQACLWKVIFQNSINAAPLNVAYATHQIRPRGYKAFFVLNSAEHEIYPAHVKIPTIVGFS